MVRNGGRSFFTSQVDEYKIKLHCLPVVIRYDVSNIPSRYWERGYPLKYYVFITSTVATTLVNDDVNNNDLKFG